MSAETYCFRLLVLLLDRSLPAGAGPTDEQAQARRVLTCPRKSKLFSGRARCSSARSSSESSNPTARGRDGGARPSSLR